MVFALAMAALPGARAQETVQPGSSVVMFNAEQLDQMLAPIALYPDALVSQILMAATYPLEVVEANRWRQDPAIASISGGQLAGALEQQPWDPSVKALVQFPGILRIMDANLAWTQQLGEAFLSQEPAVMDSIQRLRRSAQASGSLVSTPQQSIQDQSGTISIVPANPEVVYVPYYDPTVVYGGWPYPMYPPYYFPPPPEMLYGGVVFAGIWFGIGIGIVDSLWGWSHWDWPRHRIQIDVNRFNAINVHRPPVTTNIWRHDTTRRRVAPIRGGTAGPRIEPGRPGTDRQFRGYEAPSPARPSAPGKAIPQRQVPAPQRPVAPAFDSPERGAQARHDAERGRISRESTSRPAPQRSVSPPPQRNTGPARSAPAPGGSRPRR